MKVIGEVTAELAMTSQSLCYENCAKAPQDCNGANFMEDDNKCQLIKTATSMEVSSKSHAILKKRKYGTIHICVSALDGGVSWFSQLPPTFVSIVFGVCFLGMQGESFHMTQPSSVCSTNRCAKTPWCLSKPHICCISQSQKTQLWTIWDLQQFLTFIFVSFAAISIQGKLHFYEVTLVTLPSGEVLVVEETPEASIQNCVLKSDSCHPGTEEDVCTIIVGYRNGMCKRYQISSDNTSPIVATLIPTLDPAGVIFLQSCSSVKVSMDGDPQGITYEGMCTSSANPAWWDGLNFNILSIFLSQQKIRWPQPTPMVCERNPGWKG